MSERGGAILGTDARVAPDARFAVVHCRGVGTLAPVVRLDPELGTLLWLEHAPVGRSAAAGNAMLALLRGLERPILALKQGCVGGPPGRPGCFAIEPGLIELALDAGLSEGEIWERDPDFSYEVLAGARGLEGDGARALLPRLLYADHDRVYEHAALVAAKKQERWELARSLEGLDASVVAASGWPPIATSDGWKE